MQLPTIHSPCGISNCSVALVLTPIVAILVAVEAGWDIYMLAEWSDGLTTFRKIFSGLQSVFLIVLVVLLVVGMVSLWKRNERTIAIYAKGAFLKFVILALVGLIHLISVVKGRDELHDECITRGNSGSTCQVLTDVNVGLAVGLWLVQELFLFIVAVVLHSYTKGQSQHLLRKGEEEQRFGVQYYA